MFESDLTVYLSAKAEVSGISASISANPTPPSSSPTWSCSIKRWITGPTALQDGHHDAVQNVMSGTWLDAESKRREENSSSFRTLSTRLVFYTCYLTFHIRIKDAILGKDTR